MWYSSENIEKTSTPNDKYEHFVTAHWKAATEFQPVKQTAKCTVSFDLNARKMR